MNILDTSDYFNGEMDKWLEKRRLFEDTFKAGVLSVLLVDPDGQMPISDFPAQHPDLDVKYVDMAQCADGDYRLIEKQVLNGGYRGILFDNIDQIGWIDDKAELEYLVKMALKRDILPMGEGEVDFNDRMMIACRCKERPDYLDHFMQAIIIEV